MTIPPEDPEIGTRLRVAHVTLGLDMGGQEKLLVEFARHADRRSFDLCFVSLTTAGPLAREIEACSWPIFTMASPTGFRLDLMARLAWLFRRQRIDVVHTHDERPLLHAAAAARLVRVSGIIHSRHGRSPALTRRQATLVRGCAHLVDRFVCVSADSAALSRDTGIPVRKLTTIWNGIDVERFRLSGPRTDGPVVCVCRLSPEKGLFSLLEATARAAQRGKEFRLDIAGDGPCRPELSARIAQLQLGSRVRLLGQVRDISNLLEGASLFVLPSLSEGVSLTLLEAMAKGLPVVTTRVGGSVEVVEDGRTGLLVPPNVPAELAEAIVQLQRDPARCQALGLAGRRRVEEHFDVRRMVGDYERLYRGTARSRRTRQRDLPGIGSTNRDHKPMVGARL